MGTVIVREISNIVSKLEIKYRLDGRKRIKPCRHIIVCRNCCELSHVSYHLCDETLAYARLTRHATMCQPLRLVRARQHTLEETLTPGGRSCSRTPRSAIWTSAPGRVKEVRRASQKTKDGWSLTPLNRPSVATARNSYYA